MAVLVVGNVPGGNAELDQQVMQGIGVSPEHPPAGAQLRMAGPVDGGYRVITVWESEQAWETFKRDRLLPFFEKLGRPAPSYEVSNLDSFMAI